MAQPLDMPGMAGSCRLLYSAEGIPFGREFRCHWPGSNVAVETKVAGSNSFLVLSFTAV